MFENRHLGAHPFRFKGDGLIATKIKNSIYPSAPLIEPGYPRRAMFHRSEVVVGGKTNNSLPFHKDVPDCWAAWLHA